MTLKTLCESTQDYRQMFLSDTPMLDLRSPAEFAKGAFSHAVNLPLMTDDERVEVGICYKQEGREAAIALGNRLVASDVKASRMAQWVSFIKQHPNGFLYCFRGGLRSQTVQQWLRESQIDYPLIEGGYKAMRRFLIDETLRIGASLPIYVISGLTGSGKTTLLLSLADVLDLEGLANHRGSSFGSQLTPQPTQIGFENALAVSLLKREAGGAQRLLLEDESRLIGARSVPLELYRKMKNSPLIVLRISQEERIENIYQEYVLERMRGYKRLLIGDPIAELSRYLLTAISKVRKRLGADRVYQAQQLVERAIQGQLSQNQPEMHKDWIELILQDYYDPMYEYQLSKKRDRVIFEGNADQIKKYIETFEDRNPG